MASTIVTKNSSTASAVPVTGDLTQGELAVNVTDKKLYTKDSGGTVVKLVGGLGNQEANAVAITGGSINGTTVGATTASTGAFTTLSASSTTTLSGGTANGVAYLNGSKVVTTGSALTFDGTNLGLQSATNAYAGSRNGATFRANSGNGFEFILQSTNATAGTSTGFATAVTGNDVYFVNRLDGFYSWITGASGNSEQMRLTSTGLGIGTSSPSARVTSKAVGNAYTNGALALVSTASQSTYLTNTNGTFYISNDGSTDQLVMTSSGNLGLGVTPSAWSTGKAVEVGSLGSAIWSYGPTLLTTNYYYNAADKFAGTGYALTYVQSKSGGSHSWNISTASGSAGGNATMTQAMTLDASGRLGVGVTSPAWPVDVSGIVTSRSDGLAGMRFQSSANGYNGFILYETSSSSIILGNYNSGPIVLKTNDTERARIDSSGNLLVGTTAVVGSERLNVTANTGSYNARFINSNASPYGPMVNYSGAAPNGTSNECWRFEDTGGLRFQVRSNGGVVNYSANNVNLSDRREKTNFAPAGDYLAKICAIPVQTFNYIDQNMEDDPGLTLGVVAQDVEAVAPELVMESNWGTEEEPKMRLSIYQTDLQYALMKALQELKAEFDAYKATHP